jgi:hypothetical protein
MRTRSDSAHEARIRLVSDAVVASYINDISARGRQAVRDPTGILTVSRLNAKAPLSGAFGRRRWAVTTIVGG